MYGAGYSPLTAEEFYVCQIPDRTKVEEWVATADALATDAPELHWCAMCCLRSLLLAEELPAPPVEELFAAACEFGVYRPDQTIGWRGAYHNELAEFTNTVRVVSQRPAHAFRGTKKILSTPTDRFFTLEALVKWGCYFMLSVHPDVRLQSNVPPPSKRGHFVLVYDFVEEDSQKFFLINNPAGFMSQDSQVGMKISPERLEQVWSGDGICVKSRFSRLIGE